MKMNRVTGLLAIVLLLIPGSLFSQEFSVSPYSIFGIGDIQMSDGGRLAGMAGTGISVRGNRFLNTNNPASLTSLDSITFLFDVAASGKEGRFTSGNVHENAFNANFTKVSVGFKASPFWSVGAFVQPYSTVSYKITEDYYPAGSLVKETKEYLGSGGLSRFTISNGFKLSSHLSVGVNTVFLFGGIERSASQEGYTIKENAKATKVLFDFGLQYHLPVGNYELGLGLTGGYPNVLTFENRRQIFDNNDDEVQEYRKVYSQFTIPEYYGAGLSLSKGNGFILAADYRFQRWSRTTDPYSGRTFRDTHKVNAGIAFIPEEQYATSYFEIIQYQLGVTLSNSYLSLRGYNPINFEINAGAGLPLKGGSLMNVAFGYGRKGTTDSNNIKEDYFRVILSFSISERWFEKRLYQ